MIIRNVHIDNADSASDIRVEDQRFTAIESSESHCIKERSGEEVIDGHGGLMIPPFVDPHIHLDAALTAGQPEWNETLSVDDVKDRALRTLKLMSGHGIQYVRTHVDVTDPDLTALHAILELREQVSDFMDVQIVAFPQESILSFPNGKRLMERAVDEGADVVGGIPHFEFNRDYGVESLRFLSDLAMKHDRLVDVHCDEIDDPSSRNLEVLATLAYESGMGRRFTASHTTAMGSYNDA